MSIRIKVFLIITGIVLVITVSSIAISITSAQNQILITLENDMDLVASLANEYISAEAEMLKSDAATAAQMLKNVKPEDMLQALIEQVAAHENFTAITIFNETGNVDSSFGNSIAPGSIALSEYGQEAFRGRRVISTTQKHSSGAMVFYVLVPMDDYYFQSIIGETGVHPRIIACTVAGDFFSSRVGRFLIWETGNILMGDVDGTIIGNVNHEWVVERRNYIEMAKTDPKYNDVARVTKRMVNEETDTDRFILDGVDAVIAFRPITASTHGWHLAIIAPIAESPFIHVRVLLVISGLVFLGLGLIAAAIASGFIAKPFYQIKKQNEELVRLGKAAEVASKAKSAFLANMSNDMKTPLNSIIGLSEISMKKEGLPKDISVLVEKMGNQGITLLEIVDNLLDISKMESDNFELSPGKYDVAKFISSVIITNKIHIGPKPISFNLVMDKDIPAFLSGDELRVKQIFNNLLSNAFTYTKEGTVEWRISAEKDGDSVWLLSTVSDTGAGIKPENMDTLFMEYKHLSEKKEFSKESSGLGLPLTKRMIDLMDGSINVKSEFGRGTNITVKIRQSLVDNSVIDKETADALKK